MHQITEDISLINIKLEDQEKLFDLMERIYPPVYAHYWPDGGAGYLNMIYSQNNLEKELNTPNAHYYFISYRTKLVGIVRIVLNEPLEELKAENSIKLHRIYLDSTLHRMGVGKTLIHWIEKTYKTSEKSLLWLEAMDKQQTAIDFYERMGFSIVSKFRFESDFMVDTMKGMLKMAKEI